MLNKLFFYISLISIICVGCNDISRKEKFDSEKWKQYIGFDSPNRDLMAEDLLASHKLIGLSHNRMLQLLGDPTNYGDSTKTWYELSQEFDSIDPIAGKDLVITFNTDSIITNATIREWHKH